MNGKGSKQRPLSVGLEEFKRRWDETFRRTDRAVLQRSAQVLAQQPTTEKR